jgi:fatty-acyl-CoA synthase
LEFRRRAERLFGRKVGVIDREKRFTYAEFGERSRRLAAVIRQLGVAPGDVVSFLTYNTHHLLEAFYGVPQARAVLHPINIRLHAREISALLNHAESRALFFHREFAPVVEAIRDNLETVREFVILEPDGGARLGYAAEYEALVGTAAPLLVDPDVDENSVAELFYTSGTTDRPKGALLTHRALYLHALNLIIAMRYTDETVLLHVVPMFHANAWSSPHTVTGVGGTHIVLQKVDPVAIFRSIQEERVTVLCAVPSVLNTLVRHPQIGRYDLGSVQLVFTGGAPVSVTLMKEVRDAFGCETFVAYGLTEAGPLVTTARPKAHLRHETAQRQLERRASAGYAVLGVDVRVVDPEGVDVAPDGAAVGEIVARSHTIMDQYHREPGATSDAIRDGWLHTGDLATIDSEGYLNIVDRKKDIIISGGENISSVQVENVLYAHPALFECAVIAVPDERWGEVPKALVVLKPGMMATEADLREFCRERLSHFMAPKSVDFVSELPKSGTGKILKSKLREKYWAGHLRRVN